MYWYCLAEQIAGCLREAQPLQKDSFSFNENFA